MILAADRKSDPLPIRALRWRPPTIGYTSTPLLGQATERECHVPGHIFPGGRCRDLGRFGDSGLLSLGRRYDNKPKPY